MTLIFEPFGPLYEMSREHGRRSASAAPAAPRFVPPADLVVSEDAVTLTADVPGLKADQLTIEVEGDVLTLRGERPFPYQLDEGDRRTRLHLQRGFGPFERTVRLPKGVDPDAIEGSLANGVLTLRVPLPSARESQRVEVASDGEREREAVSAPA
jgi:HSP20 family protein